MVKLLVNRFIVGQEMTFQPPGGEFLLFLVVAVPPGVPPAGTHAVPQEQGRAGNPDRRHLRASASRQSGTQVDRYLLFPNVLVDVLILVLALAILNHKYKYKYKYKWVKIGR